jgi:2-polyprenyl-3-methyl-5-hydroxy-6-metoxy-1,4-benzoquinol methylase
MRYQGVINTDVKNNSHTQTIELINTIARSPLKILDVGCSSGYLGEYLKTLGHHVVGIDITSEAIDVAKNYLDEAYNEYLDVFLNKNPNRKFDVVIFGDVLEHITNSEEMLLLVQNHLEINGKIISSIPNVSHMAVRCMLLEGRWEYAELGLLDKDHVRFFTKPSIMKLFESTGMKVDQVSEVKLKIEEVDQMCGMRLNPKYVKFIKKHVHDESFEVFQYVVSASSINDPPSILCYVPDMESGLFDLRIKMPLERWAEMSNSVLKFRSFGEINYQDLNWADIVLFQRLATPDILELVLRIQESGRKVVFEIDDLLTEIPSFLQHHTLSDSHKKSLIDTIHTANLVTVSTERLACQFKQYSDRIAVIPNCVEGNSALPTTQISVDESSITLIVASSDRVLVNMITEPLLHLQSKYGNSLKIVSIGPISEIFEKSGLIIEKNPILGYTAFKEYLKTLTNPIGLIPLDDSLFSSCKSAIKYFDYSDVGIPVICSKVPPYADHIISGQNGILVDNNFASWIDQIEYLIQNPDIRKNLVNHAFKYAKENYTLKNAAIAWGKAFDSMQDLKVVSKRPIKLPRPSKVTIAKYYLHHAINPLSYIKLIRLVSNVGVNETKNRISQILR